MLAHCLYCLNVNTGWLITSFVFWVRWQSKIKFQLVIYFTTTISLLLFTFQVVYHCNNVHIFLLFPVHWKCAKSPTANTIAVFLLVFNGLFSVWFLVHRITSKIQNTPERQIKRQKHPLNNDSMAKCLKFSANLQQKCQNNETKVLRCCCLNWAHEVHIFQVP